MPAHKVFADAEARLKGRLLLSSVPAPASRLTRDLMEEDTNHERSPAPNLALDKVEPCAKNRFDEPEPSQDQTQPITRSILSSVYMPGWKPDVVIGIDFGMTCTGVAYTTSSNWTSSDWPSPTVIEDWPSRNCSAVKVPSQLSYSAYDSAIDWGFDCDRSIEPGVIGKEFKLHLNPSYPYDPPGRLLRQEAVRYYTDYMRSLFLYLDSHLSVSLPGWMQQSVEFRFSMHASWSESMIGELKSWISKAGFGTARNHRIDVSRTELDAAAVYATKDMYGVGDIIMVCDAGGGTTDISVLEITKLEHDRAGLKDLARPTSVRAGSTQIDALVRELVMAQLKEQNVRCNNDELRTIAENMMRDHGFEKVKCGFDGTQMHVNIYLPIDPRKLPKPEHAQPQHVKITTAQLKNVFDQVLDPILGQIDASLLNLTNYRPQAAKTMILCGGLGESAYLQGRLQAYLEARHPDMKIVCMEEPELAVARGLVMDPVEVSCPAQPLNDERGASIRPSHKDPPDDGGQNFDNRLEVPVRVDHLASTSAKQTLYGALVSSV